MANAKFAGVSNSYIFEGAGGMRDQLEQCILNEFQNKKYPLKATVTTLKASGKGLIGMVTASKEQCVVIQVDNDTQIAIANTTVGTYLYVAAYLIVPEVTFLPDMDNVFRQQKRNAYYAAAREIVESAFAILNLKQCNSGYHSNQSSKQ